MYAVAQSKFFHPTNNEDERLKILAALWLKA